MDRLKQGRLSIWLFVMQIGSFHQLALYICFPHLVCDEEESLTSWATSAFRLRKPVCWWTRPSFWFSHSHAHGLIFLDGIYKYICIYIKHVCDYRCCSAYGRQAINGRRWNYCTEECRVGWFRIDGGENQVSCLSVPDVSCPVAWLGAHSPNPVIPRAPLILVGFDISFWGSPIFVFSFPSLRYTVTVSIFVRQWKWRGWSLLVAITSGVGLTRRTHKKTLTQSASRTHSLLLIVVKISHHSSKVFLRLCPVGSRSIWASHFHDSSQWGHLLSGDHQGRQHEQMAWAAFHFFQFLHFY